MRRVAVILLLVMLTGCTVRPTGPVTPVIDSASIVDGLMTVSGSVRGVAADGGLCQFTFWADNGEASRLTSTGVSAGDHTECPEVEEAVAMLPPGTYRLTLTYRSDDTVDRSDEVEVVVPER